MLFGGIFAFFENFVYLFLKVSQSQSFPPPLTAKEETEYFEKMKSGDAKTRENAREKLIIHNLRLVAHIVKKYYTGNKNQDDLISIGTVGLIKAIDSFNTSNGARFATYAGKCLQNEILMFFRSQKKTLCEVSINDSIDVDKDGNPLTYIDIISTEDTVADEIDLKIQSAAIKKIVDTALLPREKKIIYLRYGLDGKNPVTQREVAKILGISRSYVSRIEKGALEKIRGVLEPDKIK